VLAFAVLLIAGGRLGDIVGRRRMFISPGGFVSCRRVRAAQNPAS